MSEQPTLSVTITNYNHAHFIPEALDAILAQSYTPLEIIIIDDGSTDNSYEILENYAKRYPLIQLLRNEQNLGVLHNVNRLLEMAKGDYIYHAASDDKVMPGFFEKSINLLSKYPQAGLCSALSLMVDEDNNNLGIVKALIFSKETDYISPHEARDSFRRHGSWIMGNTTIFRRSALIDAGGFIHELHGSCDEFAGSFVALKYGTCFIPEPLIRWRVIERGYGSKIYKSGDISMGILNHAYELMSCKYSDLFPPEFVDRYRREWLYATGLSLWKDVRNQQNNYLSQSHKWLLPRLSLPDKMFLFGIKLSMNIQVLMVKLYHFVRFISFKNYLQKKSDLHSWPGFSSKGISYKPMAKSGGSKRFP